MQVLQRGYIGVGETTRPIRTPRHQESGFAIRRSIQTKFGQLTNIIGRPAIFEFLKLWKIQHRIRPRESAPQVYTLNDSYLEGLAASLNALPKAVAGKATIAEISEQLRQEFQLTDKALIALAPWVVDG